LAKIAHNGEIWRRKKEFMEIYKNSLTPKQEDVAGVDQMQAEKILDWVLDDLYNEENASREFFSISKLKVVYMLFARLEKPLLFETCSMLNEIATFCFKQRAAIISQGLPTPERWDEGTLALLGALNIVLVIVLDYFEQKLG
jgi:hypothetical protein